MDDVKNWSDNRKTIEVLKSEFHEHLSKHDAFDFLLRLADYYRHELAYDLSEKCIEQFHKLLAHETNNRSEHLRALAEFHVRFGEYDRATRALAIDGLATDFAEFAGDRHERLMNEQNELNKLFKMSMPV